MTRDEINAIGTMLASLRSQDEASVAVGFIVHAPCSDTRNGSVSATVSADGFSATSEAVSLHDALLLARAKLAREAKARVDEVEGKPRKAGRPRVQQVMA